MAKKDNDAKTSKNAPEKMKKGGRRKWFRELRAEMKNVVWPTRKQVLNNTGVVLTVMAVMALFLFGVDSGLGAAIKAILKIGA